MSIASLLSDFGISVPRFVTVNGQIVFDGVSQTSSGGFSHDTLGSVTPVATHTFHGGTEPPDESAADWWDEPDQIEKHIRAMERSFPGFAYLPAEGDVRPCWSGVIDTGRGRFRIAVALRRDRGLPTVRVLSGGRLGVNVGRQWKASSHLYAGGNLCVAGQDDWNPDEHTAATATAWAAHWLAAYTEWRMNSQRWPVEGAHSSVA